MKVPVQAGLGGSSEAHQSFAAGSVYLDLPRKLLMSATVIHHSIQLWKGPFAELMFELGVGLIDNSLDEVDLILGRREGHARLYDILHVRRLHIKVGELRFELVYDRGYLVGGGRRGFGTGSVSGVERV